jgi:DNA-directed RNA polymerase specialized sigma24 family protein
LASLYSNHAERVRRELSSFGVPSADLDDLSQEVFLVVTDKGDTLSEIVRMDLWLREVCRKVAAGYRRRGFRKREVAVEEGV